jgi:hypothetical protein
MEQYAPMTPQVDLASRARVVALLLDDDDE